MVKKSYAFDKVVAAELETLSTRDFAGSGDENMEKLEALLNEDFSAAMRDEIERTLESPSVSGFKVKKDIKAFAKSFLAELDDSSFGGKFIRAKTLFAFAAKGLSEREVEPNTSLIQICAAIEFFQNAMLVHDDIIDQDKKRRGRDASWVKIGVEKALLLGDLHMVMADDLFTMGLAEMLRTEAISTDTFEAVQDIWAMMKRDVIIGQVVDLDVSSLELKTLFAEKVLTKVSDKNQFVALMKTASYTTIGPFMIGDMIGNDYDYNDIDPKTQEEVILEGISFQLANDRTDFAKDLRRGHISGYILLLVEMFGSDKEMMSKLIELSEKRESISDRDIRDFEDLLHESMVLNPENDLEDSMDGTTEYGD